MSSVLLASRNKGKLQEIQALLSDLEISLVTPDEIGMELDVKEKGATYAENAALKAKAFARVSGLVSLADDSGLEVDVLNGLPGIRSARFAPKPGATDADRRKYLIELLQGHPTPWRAQFRCTVALAAPTGVAIFAEGMCRGEIIPEERGLNGFGYDPVFLIPDLGRTMAELTMKEKNRLSHRANAIRAARPSLLEMLVEHGG